MESYYYQSDIMHYKQDTPNLPNLIHFFFKGHWQHTESVGRLEDQSWTYGGTNSYSAFFFPRFIVLGERNQLSEFRVYAHHQVYLGDKRMDLV